MLLAARLESGYRQNHSCHLTRSDGTLSEEPILDQHVVEVLAVAQEVEGLCKGIKNRLSPRIERGINKHSPAGLRFHGLEERMQPRLVVPTYRLRPRRAIEVRYRGEGSGCLGL